MLRLPIGLRALFVQIGTFSFCFFLLFIARKYFGLFLPFIVFLLIHAISCAIVSLTLRFDWWWAPIQFCFPLLAYVSFFLAISPQIYFIGLIILSVIFWTTFRTQVPYYPSNSKLVEPILSLLPADDHARFVDLGSGLGGLLFKLSLRRPRVSFVGVEIAPLPWLISIFRRFCRRSKVQINLGSYDNVDLTDFDVVFCYLSPAAMPKLWQRLKKEMKPGALFLSYEFIIPDVPADICLEVGEMEPVLYGWRI